MAERIALDGGSRAREEERAALPFGGRLASRVAGTLVVLACLALPVLLGELADSAESAASESYVQSLRQAEQLAAPLPPSASRPAPGARPQLLDQHYYFINGCVASHEDCDYLGVSNWGEYYGELQSLYQAAADAWDSGDAIPFEEWAQVHAHFIVSEVAPAGALQIAAALKENQDGGAVHIIGTSAGGAAVFNYLSRAMRGELPFDPRIRSVLTVDAPLGHGPLTGSGDVLRGIIDAVQASRMKTDVQPGLGRWTAAAGIAMLTIDTRQDIVGYMPLAGIPNDADPEYPQGDAPPEPAYLRCASVGCRLLNLGELFDQGGIWHIYTGSHMSVSARTFIDEHWR